MDKTMFFDLSYGMYVVTTNIEGRDVGCIANSFIQINSEDMLVALSLNKQNFTNDAIRKTVKFAISVISEKTNPLVIGKFGFFSSKDINKFEGFEIEQVEGMPVVKENTTGYFICEVCDVIETSTHDVFLAKVKNAERRNNLTPMTYSYYHNVIKGKSPQKAPTYVAEEDIRGGKYECSLCKYVYDEQKEGKSFDSLPDDWECPICRAKKDKFIKK